MNQVQQALLVKVNMLQHVTFMARNHKEHKYHSRLATITFESMIVPMSAYIRKFKQTKVFKRCVHRNEQVRAHANPKLQIWRYFHAKPNYLHVQVYACFKNHVHIQSI